MAGKSRTLTKRLERQIKGAVDAFEKVRAELEAPASGLVGDMRSDGSLGKYIHFIKYRIKKSSHLHRKLTDRALDCRESGSNFEIDQNNVFAEIKDLIGIRILHLYTAQVPDIHVAILSLFERLRLTLVEPPYAWCWDSETAKLYEACGLLPRQSDDMYTSIHYTVELNREGGYRCEIQVRTLMDEVWGEVSHHVNYPIRSKSEACQDQLKILARLTSGCVRLVDSIHKAHAAESVDQTSPEADRQGNVNAVTSHGA